MCAQACVFLLVKLPSSDPYRDRVFTRSRSLLLSSRLELIRELETRTERVYHKVNGNPGVSTPGGRQKKVENQQLNILSRPYVHELRLASVVPQITKRRGE